MPPESETPRDIPPPDRATAAQLLQVATARLLRVIDGEDVPSNLEAALRDLLAAVFCSGGGDVAPEAVHACIVALAQAEPVVAGYYPNAPYPTTVNTALRSAVGIVQLVGTPRAEWSDEAQRLLPNWADWVLALLAEMEADACMRRIVARLDPQRGREPAPPSHRLH